MQIFFLLILLCLRGRFEAKGKNAEIFHFSSPKFANTDFFSYLCMRNFKNEL